MKKWILDKKTLGNKKPAGLFLRRCVQANNEWFENVFFNKEDTKKYGVPYFVVCDNKPEDFLREGIEWVELK